MEFTLPRSVSVPKIFRSVVDINAIVCSFETTTLGAALFDNIVLNVTNPTMLIFLLYQYYTLNSQIFVLITKIYRIKRKNTTILNLRLTQIEFSGRTLIQFSQFCVQTDLFPGSSTSSKELNTENHPRKPKSLILHRIKRVVMRESKMYPWQKEIVEAVENGDNLVLAIAPSGAGKTKLLYHFDNSSDTEYISLRGNDMDELKEVCTDNELVLIDEAGMTPEYQKFASILSQTDTQSVVTSLPDVPSINLIKHLFDTVVTGGDEFARQ
jgi:hypothetical protein